MAPRRQLTFSRTGGWRQYQVIFEDAIEDFTSFYKAPKEVRFQIGSIGYLQVACMVTILWYIARDLSTNNVAYYPHVAEQFLNLEVLTSEDTYLAAALSEQTAEAAIWGTGTAWSQDPKLERQPFGTGTDAYERPPLCQNVGLDFAGAKHDNTMRWIGCAADALLSDVVINEPGRLFIATQIGEHTATRAVKTASGNTTTCPAACSADLGVSEERLEAIAVGAVTAKAEPTAHTDQVEKIFRVLDQGPTCICRKSRHYFPLAIDTLQLRLTHMYRSPPHTPDPQDERPLFVFHDSTAGKDFVYSTNPNGLTLALNKIMSIANVDLDEVAPDCSVATAGAKIDGEWFDSEIVAGGNSLCDITSSEACLGSGKINSATHTRLAYPSRRQCGSQLTFISSTYNSKKLFPDARRYVFEDALAAAGDPPAPWTFVEIVAGVGWSTMAAGGGSTVQLVRFGIDIRIQAGTDAGMGAWDLGKMVSHLATYTVLFGYPSQLMYIVVFYLLGARSPIYRSASRNRTTLRDIYSSYATQAMIACNAWNSIKQQQQNAIRKARRTRVDQVIDSAQATTVKKKGMFKDLQGAVGLGPKKPKSNKRHASSDRGAAEPKHTAAPPTPSSSSTAPAASRLLPPRDPGFGMGQVFPAELLEPAALRALAREMAQPPEFVVHDLDAGPRLASDDDIKRAIDKDLGKRAPNIRTQLRSVQRASPAKAAQAWSDQSSSSEPASPRSASQSSMSPNAEPVHGTGVDELLLGGGGGGKATAVVAGAAATAAVVHRLTAEIGAPDSITRALRRDVTQVRDELGKRSDLLSGEHLKTLLKPLLKGPWETFFANAINEVRAEDSSMQYADAQLAEVSDELCDRFTEGFCSLIISNYASGDNQVEGFIQQSDFLHHATSAEALCFEDLVNKVVDPEYDRNWLVRLFAKIPLVSSVYNAWQLNRLPGPPPGVELMAHRRDGYDAKKKPIMHPTPEFARILAYPRVAARLRLDPKRALVKLKFLADGMEQDVPAFFMNAEDASRAKLGATQKAKRASLFIGKEVEEFAAMMNDQERIELLLQRLEGAMDDPASPTAAGPAKPERRKSLLEAFTGTARMQRMVSKRQQATNDGEMYRKRNSNVPALAALAATSTADTGEAPPPAPLALLPSDSDTEAGSFALETLERVQDTIAPINAEIGDLRAQQQFLVEAIEKLSKLSVSLTKRVKALEGGKGSKDKEHKEHREPKEPREHKSKVSEDRDDKADKKEADKKEDKKEDRKPRKSEVVTKVKSKKSKARTAGSVVGKIPHRTDTTATVLSNDKATRGTSDPTDVASQGQAFEVDELDDIV